jgi:hypothetical protein
VDATTFCSGSKRVPGGNPGLRGQGVGGAGVVAGEHGDFVQALA